MLELITIFINVECFKCLIISLNIKKEKYDTNETKSKGKIKVSNDRPILPKWTSKVIVYNVLTKNISM